MQLTFRNHISFAYNKDAKDEDGFAAPITASVELPYTTDSEKRYYIGKEKNMEALQFARLRLCSKAMHRM